MATSFITEEYLVRQEGLEPSTTGLKVNYFTIKVATRIMVRQVRLELTWAA